MNNELGRCKFTTDENDWLVCQKYGIKVRIGVGCSFPESFCFHNYLSIGNDVTISEYCVLGDYCIVGDRTKISTAVNIGDNCHISTDVLIGIFCFISESVTICRDAFIGNESIIKENVTIGKDFRGESFINIGKETIIGIKVKFGRFVKIGKRCRIGNNIVIGNRVEIKDQIYLMDNVHIDDNSCLNQTPLQIQGSRNVIHWYGPGQIKCGSEIRPLNEWKSETPDILNLRLHYDARQIKEYSAYIQLFDTSNDPFINQ